MTTFSGGPSAAQVVARRRAERERLIEEARSFVERLAPHLGVRWAVVFGSVARGDFSTRSDVDVLVVAERLPEAYRDRLEALGWPTAGRVEPIAWTPDEYARQLGRRDPIAVEALEEGVWLAGEPPAPR